MRQGSDISETRDDVLIRGLWERKTDAIINVKFVDSDADTCMFEPMVTFLAWWEKKKKDNHCKHCHEQQKHFSPFFLSVDGMLGREALVVLANFIQLVAEKIDEPILHV